MNPDRQTGSLAGLSFGWIFLCFASVGASIPTACSSPSAQPNTKEASTSTNTSQATNTMALPERIMVDVTTNHWQTLIGFFRNSPPPWTNGNRLRFEIHEPASPGHIETWQEWQVVNIHAENLAAISEQLGIKLVEVTILPVTNFQSITLQPRHPEGPGQPDQTALVERKIFHSLAYAVVTDSRILRGWFHQKPSTSHLMDSAKACHIKATYPLSFRK